MYRGIFMLHWEGKRKHLRQAIDAAMKAKSGAGKEEA